MFHVLHHLRPQILSTIQHQVGERIQQLLRPSTNSLVAGAAADMIRRWTDLIAENALFRQQLIVLHTL